jgi:hypothetical protein
LGSGIFFELEIEVGGLFPLCRMLGGLVVFSVDFDFFITGCFGSTGTGGFLESVPTPQESYTQTELI